MRKTTTDTADYWTNLANWYPKSSQFSNKPFHAVYEMLSRNAIALLPSMGT